MIYLYNYLTPKYFYLFLVLIYIFLLVIIFFKKSIYKKLPLETYKKNPEMLLDYLDKYYIKNKYITFGLVIFYILLKVGVVLYLRYLYLGNEIYITRILSETYTLSIVILLKSLFLLILFIINLHLIYFLLYKIFFDEMLKIYIYCMRNKLIYLIEHKRMTFYAEDIWGPCYLFFECIYRKTPTPDPYFYNQYYCYENIYENYYIKKITLNMIILSEKYVVIFWIIKLCRKLCHILYVHASRNNIWKYLPICLLILAFFYDFFQGNIYYTYYMLFIYYTLTLYNNFSQFTCNIDPLLRGNLTQYFYKNIPEYSKQRERFFDYKNSRLFLKEDYDILHFLNDPKIIEHIYYDFKPEKGEENTKMFIMNLRFYTIVLLSVLVIYLIYLIANNKIVCNYTSYVFIGTICILWFFTIFYGKNTYVLEKEDPKDDIFPMYIYNKKYEVIFWLLILIQAYIYWKLLFKPQIFFMDTDILLQLPFDILKITKIYNSEDQILYLFQYFDNYLNAYNMTIESQHYLRHILRQIDFYSLIIDNNLRIKDLEVYAKIFIENYALIESFKSNFFLLEIQLFNDLQLFNYINNFKEKIKITDEILWNFLECNKDNIMDFWQKTHNLNSLKYFIKDKFFNDYVMDYRNFYKGTWIILFVGGAVPYAFTLIKEPANDVNALKIFWFFVETGKFLRDFITEDKLKAAAYVLLSSIMLFFFWHNIEKSYFFQFDTIIFHDYLYYVYKNAHKVFNIPDFSLSIQKNYEFAYKIFELPYFNNNIIINKGLFCDIKEFFISKQKSNYNDLEFIKYKKNLITNHYFSFFFKTLLYHNLKWVFLLKLFVICCYIYLSRNCTKNLNNNSEALNNVHMNASKQPTQKTNTDSNDPTNLS